MTDLGLVLVALAIWGIMCAADSCVGRYPYGRTRSTSA